MAKVVVKLEVDVDLGAWAAEYSHPGAAQALVEALGDLREPGHYLQGEKWSGLATITSVNATLDLNM